MSGVGAGVTDADTVGVGNAVGTVTSAAALLVGVVPMAAGAPPVAVQAASTALHNREIKSSNRFFITFPPHTVIKSLSLFQLRRTTPLGWESLIGFSSARRWLFCGALLYFSAGKRIDTRNKSGMACPAGHPALRAGVARSGGDRL